MNWNPTEWLSDCGRFDIALMPDKTFWLQRLKPFKKSKVLAEVKAKHTEHLK